MLRQRAVDLMDEAAQAIAETTDVGSAERTSVVLKALGMELDKVKTRFAELGQPLEGDANESKAWDEANQRVVQALSNLTALDAGAARIVTSALSSTILPD